MTQTIWERDDLLITGPTFVLPQRWDGSIDPDPLPMQVEIRLCVRTRTSEPFTDDDGYNHDGYLRLHRGEAVEAALRIVDMLNAPTQETEGG